MAFENVDYIGAEPAALIDTEAQDAQFHQGSTRTRHFYGYSGRTVVKLLATLIAGALIGATGHVLQLFIDAGVSVHNQLLQQALSIGLVQAMGSELIISTSLVLAAAAMVLLFAPLAAGGGVAAVMAALNGNDIPGLLGLDVYAVKLVGCMLSRVARLAVGVEAPMAHLGACVASVTCRCEQSFWEWVQKRQGLPAGCLTHSASYEPEGYEALPAGSEEPLQSPPQSKQQQQWGGLRAGGPSGEVSVQPAGSTGEAGGAAEEDEEQQAVGSQAAQVDHSIWHRELVSAGVAAGIAGAFGAPLGGVLFALEEACSHWSRKVAWRCFLCAAMATFVHSQLSATSDLGILAISGAPSLEPHQWLLQLPLMAAVSAGAGLLGASLNLLRRWLRRLCPPRRTPARSLAEATAVAAVTVATIAGLSTAVGSCRPLPQHWGADEAVRHLCPEGQYNDLATMFLGSSVFIIKSLIGQGSKDRAPGCNAGLLHECYFSLPSLAALCASYLLLAALSSSLVVPGGLFMPSILVGGSFGTLCGTVLAHLLPSAGIQPGVMAVVGTAAALGGVFQSSISLVAILVEGTQGFNQALGIIVAIAISHYMAHLCGTDSVYHDDLANNESIMFLHEDPPSALKQMTAKDIMTSPVLGFDAIVPVAHVKEVLRQTTHNCFPVHTVRDPISGRGRLDGLILRSQLLVLLRNRAFCDARGRYLHIPLGGGPQLEQQLALAMQERTRRSHKGRLLLVFDGSSSVDASPLRTPLRSLEPGWWSDADAEADDKLDGVSEEAQQAQGLPTATWAPVHEGEAALSAAAQQAGLGPSLGVAAEPPWQAYCDQLQPTLHLQQGPAQAASASRPILQLEPAEEVCALRLGGLGGGEGGKVGWEEQGSFLNLAPFMNRAPLSVRRFTPACRVHGLFLSLSLRHLCVIDRSNAAVGMITRHDLVHAAE